MGDLLVPVFFLVGVLLMGIIINEQHKAVVKEEEETDSEVKNRKVITIIVEEGNMHLDTGSVTNLGAITAMLLFSVRLAKVSGMDRKTMVETIDSMYESEEV